MSNPPDRRRFLQSAALAAGMMGVNANVNTHAASNDAATPCGGSTPARRVCIDAPAALLGSSSR